MELAALITRGLTKPQKSLPPVLFYDEVGSALFDEITRTPEYYLTRVERAILHRHGREILGRANGHGPLDVVELGAGSAEKTRVLLRQLVEHQRGADYWPIDVSRAPLLAAAESLPRDIPGLRVRPLVGDNLAMLQRLPRGSAARVVLFIGSSIGNYEPEEAAHFLAEAARSLRPHDALLLGTDLVKDAATLEPAYDDAAGVTARFNLNALARLNREYGADFHLDAFRHRAFFNEQEARIEMHLEALRPQRVRISELDLTLQIAEGETIHTENSYKFTLEGIRGLVASAGLEVRGSWTDESSAFAVSLLGKVRA